MTSSRLLFVYTAGKADSPGAAERFLTRLAASTAVEAADERHEAAWWNGSDGGVNSPGVGLSIPGRSEVGTGGPWTAESEFFELSWDMLDQIDYESP
ncbi:hypothetical protein EYF80_014572 [Liparis tanakae]|uniref:Uncharacterized protein n=1 Tax=Liparis tanakae TaxID=230148 RepID=A0A4Z2ICK2_9TELE|nr:hypothetical protein EYF80_014572 [Liparis tanakae]